jgi:hypothetical protein
MRATDRNQADRRSFFVMAGPVLPTLRKAPLGPVYHGPGLGPLASGTVVLIPSYQGQMRDTVDHQSCVQEVGFVIEGLAVPPARGSAIPGRS